MELVSIEEEQPDTNHQGWFYTIPLFFLNPASVTCNANKFL